MKVLALESRKRLVEEFKPVRKLIDRKFLKDNIGLTNLNGGSYSKPVYDMIIPGGLNKFEKIYYQLNGNYPRSVQDRWFEKNSGRAIQPGDYEVKIGDHIIGDPEFELHPVHPSEYTSLDVDGVDISDDGNSEGLLGKFLDFITGGD